MLALSCRLTFLLVTTLLPNVVEAAAEKAFKADSVAGKRLLQKAIVIEASENDQRLRRAADQQNYYQYDNQYGISDLASLYIQYSGCSSFLTPDQGEDSNDGQVNYYNYQQNGYQQQQQQQQQDGDVYYNDGMIQKNLVRFTLCSNYKCRKCYGEYAVDMTEFLNAYTEMQMEDEEYQCEYVREHCYCSSGYYENCLSTCYANAGLDNCMQEYYGGETFELQEYIECQAAFGGGNGDGNNKYNYAQSNLYIGPYCMNNQYIYLGAFYDEQCTYQADADTFQAQNYGDGFPYFDEPILSGSECISCVEVGGQQANDDQNNQNSEANELCDNSIEEGIKCDSKRGYSSGCTFLQDTLPCLDGRSDCSKKDYQGGSSSSRGSNNSDSTSDLYQEMARQIRKNKRAAFAMGALAGALLLGSISMCLWCYCRPSLLQSSKRNPLLRRRQNGGVGAPTQ